MKKTKFILLFALLIIVMYTIYIIKGSPIIINFTKNKTDNISEKHIKGDTICPFAGFDFNNGRWVALLIIHRDDFKDLSNEMPKWMCLKTSDKNLLKQMQKDMKFICTGGDIATVESYMVLYHNGKEVFRSGIVLDEASQDLQGEYGWLLPLSGKSMINDFKQFKKVYAPVIFLY